MLSTSKIAVKVSKLSKWFFRFNPQELTLKNTVSLLKKEQVFKHEYILRDISFEIKCGENVALLGVNGSGKTTLLKILSGLYSCSGGDFYLREDPQALFRGLSPIGNNLSVADNFLLLGVLYGMKEEEAAQKLEEMFKFAELESMRNAYARELSLGQMQRVALSAFFFSENNIVFLDESFALIDKNFRKKCDRFLQSLCDSDKTVIIASHDIQLLRTYCRTGMLLDGGRVRCSGPIEEVLALYENSC